MADGLRVVIDVDGPDAQPVRLVRSGVAPVCAAPCKPFYRDGVCASAGCARLHSELALTVRDLPPAQGLSSNERARIMASLFSAFGPVGAVVTRPTEGCVVFGSAADLDRGACLCPVFFPPVRVVTCLFTALSWQSVRFGRFMREDTRGASGTPGGSGSGRKTASRLGRSPSGGSGEARGRATSRGEGEGGDVVVLDGDDLPASPAIPLASSSSLHSSDAALLRSADSHIVALVAAEPSVDPLSLQRVWEALSDLFPNEKEWLACHRQQLKQAITTALEKRHGKDATGKSKRKKRKQSDDEDREGAGSVEDGEGDEGEGKRKKHSRQDWEARPDDGLDWSGPTYTYDKGDGRTGKQICKGKGCKVVRTVVWNGKGRIVDVSISMQHSHPPPSDNSGAAKAAGKRGKRHTYPKVAAIWKLKSSNSAIVNDARHTTRYLMCVIDGCPARRKMVYDEDKALVGDTESGEHNHVVVPDK